MNPATTNNAARARIALLFGLMLPVALPADASTHMRDFLLAESAYVAAAGETWLISAQDGTWRRRNHAVELSPGIMHGLTDWLTVGVDADLVRPRGGSFSHETTRPYAQLRLGSRLSALAAGLRADFLAHHAGDTNNEVRGAALLAYSADDWTYAFGVHYQRETTSRGADGWTLSGGLRAQVSPRVAYGLETRAALHRRGSTEVLAGAYVDPSPRFSLHIGVGSGIIRGPGVTFRSALIWRAQ